MLICYIAVYSTYFKSAGCGGPAHLKNVRTVRLMTIKYCVPVMGVKGRRVHMIEEMSDTIISFQRGNCTSTTG